MQGRGPEPCERTVTMGVTQHSTHSILYLDYDGVLHPADVRVRRTRGIYVHSPAGSQLFEHADLLEELLAPYPQVSVVLSTSWVRVRGFTHARNRLPAGLRRRVIGATYHRRHMREWEFTAMPRGMQVWQDVVRRKPSRWLALDDDGVDWPIWCLAHFVTTHETRGISDPSTQGILRQALTRNCWRSPRTDPA